MADQNNARLVNNRANWKFGNGELELSLEQQLNLVIRRGQIEQVQMGCKQRLACENNKRQNFVGRIPGIL